MGIWSGFTKTFKFYGKISGTSMLVKAISGDLRNIGISFRNIRNNLKEAKRSYESDTPVGINGKRKKNAIKLTKKEALSRHRRLAMVIAIQFLFFLGAIMNTFFFNPYERLGYLGMTGSFFFALIVLAFLIPSMIVWWKSESWIEQMEVDKGAKSGTKK
jgi:polyferredoxin